MNYISECCRVGTVKGRKYDHNPLGTKEYNGYGLTYTIDVCESCGLEAELVEVTECCGEETCTC